MFFKYALGVGIKQLVCELTSGVMPQSHATA